MLRELTEALGYRASLFYREGEPADLLATTDLHWYRAAKAAGVQGTYYFRTSERTVRPAVHVAQVTSREEGRKLHRSLWNQGINPFLILLLPGEVRVYSGFAYHPKDDAVGSIKRLPVDLDSVRRVADSLRPVNAHAIDCGEIWSAHARHLRSETRVDATLLAQLKILSHILRGPHYGLDVQASHALIGKFVYLHYLRARDILSDQWLQEETNTEPRDVFSRSATLAGFRRVAEAVERRFNGKVFEFPWSGARAPKAAAVQLIATVFAGDTLDGQLHLPFDAYDFASIPIELLSTIYEQFLHAEGLVDTPSPRKAKPPTNPDSDGAHYTPEPLAEYLVSEVDSVHPLQPGMRILDPCCGSGVFLVVAYRRLIELHRRTVPPAQKLRPSELRRLLIEHIYGVEKNSTACQITAFTLILAMLSHIEPPELDGPGVGRDAPAPHV